MADINASWKIIISIYITYRKCPATGHGFMKQRQGSGNVVQCNIKIPNSRGGFTVSPPEEYSLLLPNPAEDE